MKLLTDEDYLPFYLLIWAFTFVGTLWITFVLVGGLLRTDVMITHDHPQAGEPILESMPGALNPETKEDIVTVSEYLFDRNPYGMDNYRKTGADGRSFNKSSHPLYLIFLYLLCCSPLLYIWIAGFKPNDIESWSKVLNKAIWLFLSLSLIGAIILRMYENIMFENMTCGLCPQDYLSYDPLYFPSRLSGWEDAVHRSMINYFILPILLIVTRIALYLFPEEQIAKQKSNIEENTSRTRAIDKIKRAKELKELGVISEAEFQSVLRKHKGDATKGL